MNTYLTEFLGTLFLLYVILLTKNVFVVAAAFMIVIMLGSPISGAYYNPAITVMMASAGKLPTSEVLPYILSQIGGGLVALELFKRIKL